MQAMSGMRDSCVIPSTLYSRPTPRTCGTPTFKLRARAHRYQGRVEHFLQGLCTNVEQAEVSIRVTSVTSVVRRGFSMQHPMKAYLIDARSVATRSHLSAYRHPPFNMTVPQGPNQGPTLSFDLLPDAPPRDQAEVVVYT